jgi:hypothetical protein
MVAQHATNWLIGRIAIRERIHKASRLSLGISPSIVPNANPAAIAPGDRCCISTSINGLVVLFAVPEVIGKYHRYAISISREEHFFYSLTLDRKGSTRNRAETVRFYETGFASKGCGMADLAFSAPC